MVAMMKGTLRNRICYCGSGKKFKHCCWKKHFTKDLTVEQQTELYNELYRKISNDAR